jgi:hypothetical protein
MSKQNVFKIDSSIPIDTDFIEVPISPRELFDLVILDIKYTMSRIL